MPGSSRPRHPLVVPLQQELDRDVIHAAASARPAPRPGRAPPRGPAARRRRTARRARRPSTCPSSPPGRRRRSSSCCTASRTARHSGTVCRATRAWKPAISGASPLAGRHPSLRSAAAIRSYSSVLRPVAVAGRVDRGHRETALGREAARAGHDAGAFLCWPPPCPIRISGRGPGRAGWRPQHAGDVAEGEELFADAVGRRRRDEAHSVCRPFGMPSAGTP